MKENHYKKKLIRSMLYIDKIMKYKYDLSDNELVEIIEKPSYIIIKKAKQEKGEN